MIWIYYEVRKWTNNYYPEYYGYNRSEGAKMTEKYLPSVLKGE